jgi:O-antigen/teichoic acid export membrane protein
MLFIPLYLAVGNLIGIVLFNNSMSGILLQLAAICILPITLCNLSGSVLNALNLEKKSFLNYLLGSAVLFTCLIIFTPIVGIHSIIISFFLSMSLISYLNLRKIKAEIGDLELNFIPTLMKYCIIIAPSSVFGHIISNICLTIFNNFFSAVIGGGIAIVFVLILAKIFNLFNLRDLFSIVKSRKKIQKA